MSDTTVQLDDFVFQSLEVPERIPFGGSQRMTVHELVGGVRVVDTMGAIPIALEWSGYFLGQSAVARARTLDQKRSAGLAITLKWSELSFLVVIREFAAQFERFYRVPYRIVCEVIADQSQPPNVGSGPSVDTIIAGDMTTASGYVSQINDSTLSSLYASVTSAIGQVSSFASAAQSQINSVLQPIQAVRNQVGVLIANANNTLANVTTIAGILPNNPISTQVANLSRQITAAQQLPVLINLDRTMGRVAYNAQANYNSAKVVTTAGTDLMRISAAEYGDVSGWTGIAKANGLSDPQVTGIKQIVVPPTKDTSGGVLVG